MSATEQCSNFDPSLDYDLFDMSLEFQESTWDQFEYEWITLMSSDVSDQSMIWNYQPSENLFTESPIGLQPISSWPTDPRVGLENSIDDVFYPALEISQITPLSSSIDSYSPNTSLTSDSPQQNFLSPLDTMASTSPSVPPETFYACDTCAKRFEKKNILKRHKKQHEKPFHCHLCVKRFAENRDMRRHLVVHHSSQTPGLSQSRYLCSEPGCRFAQGGFGRKDHLTRHMRRAHSRLTP